MDHARFDAWTRSIVTRPGRRRSLLRLVAGSTLGVVAAHLGVAEGTEAKPRQHRRKRRSSHRHETATRAQGHGKPSGGVQSERKHKHKGKHRKQKPHDPTPPPLPPGCEHCNECEMCQDGACVPDQALGGVPCQGSGAGCNHCLNGQCVPTEQLPCDDGLCAHRGQCCPGEQYCTDQDSPLGYSCIGQTDCCPGQKKCTSGACISYWGCCDEDRPTCGACDTPTCDHGSWYCPGNCCSTQKQCPDGTCVGPTDCCPGQHQCPDGSCIRNFDCCPGEHKCSDGLCAPAGTCCLNEKRCADGSCKECCPEDKPTCSDCEVATCTSGGYVCSPNGACGPKCGEGYCPKDMYCHHPGTCCGTSGCVCASGYANPPGCNAYGQCCRTGCCYPYCCEDPRAG